MQTCGERSESMTRPNSITTNYSYDSLSRLLSVLHQSGGSTIDGATYTVDAAGNRTSKQDWLASLTSNYTYDAIYQLTQVTQGTSSTESYSYDPVGNRTASLGGCLVHDEFVERTDSNLEREFHLRRQREYDLEDGFDGNNHVRLGLREPSDEHNSSQ